MINKLTVRILAITGVLAPLTTLAQAGFTPPAPSGVSQGVGNIGVLQGTLQRVTTFIASVIVAVSVVMILYAAFLFVTAGDDEEKVGSARKTITWGIIGLIVAILAYYVPGVVAGALGLNF